MDHISELTIHFKKIYPSNINWWGRVKGCEVIALMLTRTKYTNKHFNNVNGNHLAWRQTDEFFFLWRVAMNTGVPCQKKK